MNTGEQARHTQQGRLTIELSTLSRRPSAEININIYIYIYMCVCMVISNEDIKRNEAGYQIFSICRDI